MVDMKENFEEVYEKYYKRVYKYVYDRIDRKSDVEDIVQEVFVKVFKNLKYYDEYKGKMANFVLANANQVVVEYYRKGMSERDKFEAVYEENERLVYEYFEKIDGEYGLEKFLCKLPKMQRRAIELVYLDGLSYRTAARILNKSELSIKSLIFRAKNKLKLLIEDDGPEIRDEYFGKKMLKIIVLSMVSISMITGLTYAIVKIYESIVNEKNTYTLNEVEQEISAEESNISEEEAVDYIQKYLSILEMQNVEINEDIKLFKDYQVDRLCWTYKCEDYVICVAAENGDFISFHTFIDNEILADRNYLELLKALEVTGYELYKEVSLEDVTNIVLYKKYGDLFNKYQSVSIMYDNDFLQMIYILDCDYEDKEILVSEEQAIEICKKLGEDIEEVSIVIENIKSVEDNGLESIIYLDENNIYNNEVRKKLYDIRKVWKCETEDDKIIFIDVNSGEVFYGREEELTVEERGN